MKFELVTRLSSQQDNKSQPKTMFIHVRAPHMGLLNAKIIARENEKRARIKRTSKAQKCIDDIRLRATFCRMDEYEDIGLFSGMHSVG